MRGAEFLLLAAFVGLVGLGLWNFRHWLEPAHPGTSAVARAVSTSPPAVKRSGAKAGKSGHFSGSPGLQPGSVGVTTVEVPPMPTRFPDAKDLIAGMTGSQLRAVFGDPVARVTRADKGEISERYYYVNEEHTRVTVANLQGGIVVSAESVRL